MTGQVGRSLKLSTTGIQKANESLANSFVTKSDLAAHISATRANKKGASGKDTVGISRTTIDEFFDGAPKSAKVFKEICAALKLKWQEVADLPTALKPTTLLTSNPTVSGSSHTGDIDALVQQVRSRLLPFITAPHSIIGTMRMFSVSQPVPVDKIYIDLNVLEQVSSSRHFSNWRGEYEPGNRQDFDRLSLSQVKQKGVEAISVIKDYAKLLVLGKPGAGKTTFLKSLAVKCIQPEENFFADLVPLFVTLPEFAKRAHETSWDLLDYLAEALSKQSNGCDANVKEILVQGRSLVLLDGLDEVPSDDMEKVIDAVRDFVGYRNNRLVITCRTQSQKELEGFTDVEVDNFTPEQVDRFVENWFKIVDSGAQASLAPQLQQQLRAAENKTIAELTVTPVLLNLICAVFRDEQGNLPKKRSQLYEKGIRQLLERLKRMPSDRKLTIDIKEEFLAELAVMLFEKNDYFPEEQTLEKFICNYFGVERSTARNIMKIFETETGLLIERSAGYWSFSHLTFQEYLVAKWFCKLSELEKFVNHITERPWKEIFLLTIELLKDSSTHLEFINIRVIEIQRNISIVGEIIHWIDRKSNLAALEISHWISMSIKMLDAVALEKDIVTLSSEDLKENIFTTGLISECRCFYLDLFNAYSISDAFISDANILNHLSLYNRLNKEVIDFVLILDNLLYWLIRFLPSFPFFLTQPCVLNQQVNELEKCLLQIFNIINAASSRGIFFNEIYDRLLCLWNKMLIIKSKLIASEKDREGREIIDLWNNLFNEGKNEDFLNLLKNTISHHRDIPHHWLLDDKQKEDLSRYYEANKLLVDCLIIALRFNSVSTKTGEKIKENLLLPIAEIEKRKQEKAE
ncbi:NACHT domain-containing protein [Microcoleus sp. B4-D4]|uniref:NACHT domain-containing protein n=1 Tax=Microcoleus sp. B4-D4 TaxID=2818667 RepID=UPI002FD41AB5